MFTYDLTVKDGRPLYEKLTACIRNDILSGIYTAGQKLPSKRRAAVDLGISVVTVQSAYDQLLAEGYLCARERSGYFVASLEELPSPMQSISKAPTMSVAERSPRAGVIDLVSQRVSPQLFPLSIWTKLSRRVLTEQGEALLAPAPPMGLPSLREAIARTLLTTRGIHTSPDCILIGAGNQGLYHTLLLLLGQERLWATENPGYSLIPRLYRQMGAQVTCLPMDEQGVELLPLEASGASVLHISPAHHFPTGILTGAARRRELLRWAEENHTPKRYILEDDYDSEFRMGGRPIPPLCRGAEESSVIYINTFSKTISPSLRIAYAVLPPALAETYEQKLSYLACPVPSFEQYVLAAFLNEGYFERHINRTRTRYRELRNALLSALSQSPYASKYSVKAADGGLHFLLQLEIPLSDQVIKAKAADLGIEVKTLSDYFDPTEPIPHTRTLVVSYAGLSGEQIPSLISRLDKLISSSSRSLPKSSV